jgi:hypothetical protein
MSKMNFKVQKRRQVYMLIAVLSASLLITCDVSIGLITSSTTLACTGTIIGGGTKLNSGLPAANSYFIKSTTNDTYYWLNSDGSTRRSSTDAAYLITQLFGNMSAGQKLVSNGGIVFNSPVEIYVSNIYWDTYQSNIISSSTGRLIDISGCNNVTICSSVNGTEIRGPSASSALRTYGSNQVTIVNETILSVGPGGFGIDLENCWNAVVTYNTLKLSTASYGIVGNNAGLSTVSFNTVDNCWSGGCIGMFGDGTGYYGASVTGNTISNWGAAATSHGIYIAALPNSIVSNNILSNGNSGYVGCAFLIKSYKTTVCYNTLNPVHAHGFMMYREGAIWESSPNSTSIYGNTLIGDDQNTGAPFYAFYIETNNAPNTHYPVCNLNISFNFLSKWNTALLAFGRASTECVEGTIFQNNAVSGCTYMIRSELTTPIYVNNITIRDNTLSNVTNPIDKTYFEASATNVVRYNNTGLGATYYMLNVTAIPTGTTSPNGSGWQYPIGSTQQVTFTPSDAQSFVNWKITTPSLGNFTSNPLSLTMNQSYVLTGYQTSNG